MQDEAPRPITRMQIVLPLAPNRCIIISDVLPDSRVKLRKWGFRTAVMCVPSGVDTAPTGVLVESAGNGSAAPGAVEHGRFRRETPPLG
jgi:hypothetical protein